MRMIKGTNMTPVFLLCRRELRHGVHGFGVFLGCLILGVFAITGVGTFSESARQGLLRDARSIMGGDIEIMLTARSLTSEQEAFFKEQGDISRIASTRTMARPVMRSSVSDASSARAVLVEVKGVDRSYPLYGQVRTISGVDIRSALAGKDGMPGALVDRLLLDRLQMKVGDVLGVGAQKYRVGGVIAFEPDRVVQAFAFGPRVMVDLASLDASGLTAPGSLIRYRYRIRLQGKDPLDVITEAGIRFPRAGWAIRDYSRAAPTLRRLLERLDIDLTLMGLAALLVGGLGISGGVRGYLGPRLERIAVMKCLGGTGRVLLGSYLLQVLILGGVGSLAGMLLGALVPWGVMVFWGESLPVHVRSGIYFAPMFRAGLFGICTTLAFSTGPLVRAVNVSPSALFRGYVNGRESGGFLARALPVFFFTLLSMLIFVFAGNMKLAAGFVFGTAACFVLFRLAAELLKTAARRVPFIPNPCVRLGLGQIVRPGAPTVHLVFALGLGLTCLVAVALVNINLTRALGQDIAGRAPSFFFMDVMPGQVERFQTMVQGISGSRPLDLSPVIRGRILKIAGKNVEDVRVAPEVSWAVRGDRMLTYAAVMPEHTDLARGEWWPAGYAGPARISLTSDLARGFGVDLGDTLTINVLGRDITATIANIRDVDWRTLSMQFAIIFAPGVLDTAPQTFLAAVRADTPGAEAGIFETVSRFFPAVAIIRVKEVLDHVGSLFSRMAAVFQAISGIALLSGFLVLAGAFSADQHRRIYDAVVYKVCGATRRDILLALITEFAVIGIGTGVISCVTGALAAWGVIHGFMQMRFVLDPSVVLCTVLAGTLMALFSGLAGTVRALGKKPAPYLRNE